ncbi:nitroreductase [Actinoalloteichus sp. AHMU CJ021]|uniref:nitroreductase family protein n=1 Tax=Actinoalloteichus sp. AHMU CJ021 TaxID=2072503 RepID=UPI000CA02795|nr:nitroreductase [Actinoalloteichus sp. AHMU CJ021]
MTETEAPDERRGGWAETSAPVHPLIAGRWSPRSLDPTATVSEEALRALFEAARWAPSWGNTQPARYLLGRRGDDTFDRILQTLNRGNRGWAQSAGALVVGVATVLDGTGQPLPYAEYGLGLATQNLVLQAVAEGLVAHQMAGFDSDAVAELFDVPDSHEARVVIAVGHLAAPGTGDPVTRERDARPRVRRDLSELVFHGDWAHPAYPGAD